MGECGKFVLLLTNVERYILHLCCLVSIVKGFNLASEFSDVISDPGWQEGSYFGYTVLLRSPIEGYAASIVIGAPRANSTYTRHRKIVEPGVVYQCNIDDYFSNVQVCYPLLLDKTGNEKYTAANGFAFKHRKEHAYFGAAIDGSPSRGGRFVACGPRWVNQNYKNVYLNNGLCYWLPDTTDANRTAEKLMPLIDATLQNFNGITSPVFGYAFGEAGFSVHMSELDGSDLLIGAPGLNNWKGGIIRYKDASNNYEGIVSKREIAVNEYGNVLIPDTYYNTKIGVTTYFGYSVSSGLFLHSAPKKRFYAAGAPRDGNYYGRVFLFELMDQEIFRKQEINIVKELQGEQMGEYFGASLCIVDINGDRLDDVIVGAPHHNTNNEMGRTMDEGIVYVFINYDEWKFEKQPPLEFKNEPGSQFGTAIASLGDLNRDGFNDVAIGAPYEDDGRGCVYVYLGTSRGLSLKYSQQIRAEVINTNLFGFGFSLSRGVDIDENLYNDLAVGAYRSGHAVLIKSWPVARLRSRIISSVEEISLDTTEFSIRACINYLGTGVAKTANISMKLNIDPVFKRANIYQNESESNSTSTLEYLVEHLPVNVERCDNFTIIIQAFHQDFSKPIDLELRDELSENPALKKEWCPTCPVRDPSESNVVRLQVPYATGCGDDNRCHPDLALDAAFIRNDKKLVIGTVHNVMVDISIRNSGEPAFLSRLKVIISNDVSLIEIPSACDDFDPNSMICNLGNIFNNTEKKLLLNLDISQISTELDKLRVQLFLKSVGEDVNELNNRFVLELPLVTETRLILSGKSTPEQIQYKDEANINKVKNSIERFSQEYEIRNLGPSPLGQALIEFFIPISYNNITLLHILEPKAYLDGQPIVCTSTAPGFYVEPVVQINVEDDANGATSDTNNGVTGLEIRRRRDMDPMVNPIPIGRWNKSNRTRFVLETEESWEIKAQGLPVNRTLFLNCLEVKSDDSDILEEIATQCLTVSCQIGMLRDSKSSATIRFPIQAHIHNIEQVLEKTPSAKKDIVLVQVKSALVPLNPSGTKDAIRLNVYTTLLGALPEEVVPIWVTILGVCIGVLILGLITYGLVKYGFFKRATKEELELLKGQQINEEFQQNEEINECK